MNRRPIIILVAFLGILALTVTMLSGLTASTQLNADNPSANTSTKTGPLDPEEMMTMLTEQAAIADILGLGTDGVVGKVSRWNDATGLDDKGRYGYVIAISKPEQMDSCLIDFERNGSVRQSMTTGDTTLILQVYENDNCSEKSFAAVALTADENGVTLVENYDAKPTTEPYVAIVKIYTSSS